jgi:hypothetical protein
MVGGTPAGFKAAAPLRDQLAITSEHDCLGRNWRDVHSNLPTTVVAERLGDELSRNGRGRYCHYLLVSSSGGHRKDFHPTTGQNQFLLERIAK